MARTLHELTDLCRVIEEVIQTLPDAFHWLKRRKKDAGPNHSVWHLLFHWEQIHPALEAQLREGTYGFSPVKHFRKKDGQVIDVWDAQDLLVMKALALCLNRVFQFYLARTCMHVKDRGGCPATVRQVKRELNNHYDRVCRTDVAQYYTNIDHTILLKQLATRVKDEKVMRLLQAVCQRTVIYNGHYQCIQNKSIARGSPLSPLFAAIYLTPLDRAMEAFKGKIFYRRFMDDWVILSRGQQPLRRAVKAMYRVLDQLKLKVHPDKTFIGRVTLGFSFLGYWLTPHDCRVSLLSLYRCLTKSCRLLERNHSWERLETYWQYWHRWAHTQALSEQGISKTMHLLRKQANIVYRYLLGCTLGCVVAIN